MRANEVRIYRLLTALEDVPKGWLNGMILGAILILGIIDYYTGVELSLSFFYLIPVAIAAWALGKYSGLGYSVLSATVWLVSNLLSGLIFSNMFFGVWNTLIRFGFYGAVTILLTELHSALEEERLLADPTIDQAIVFTSTQRDAERLSEKLEADGHSVAALHGGMPQGVRTRTLTGLRQGRLRVLVATDVAARGIDVPTISHVINYGLPIAAEDYVHRIGRTGRAGNTGIAVTLAEHGEIRKIRTIERFTDQRIPVATIEGLEPTQRAAPHGAGRPGNGPRRGPPGAHGGARFDGARRDGAGAPRTFQRKTGTR